MAERIIIDTDIGDDIDDAQAIVLALKSPEIEIVGITTVFRDVRARAQITKQLLSLAGREDIPVYQGCGAPLLVDVDLNAVPPQYGEELRDIPVDDAVHGVDYLIDTVNANPGEITVAAIGPATNVAMALRRDPRFARNVKEVVWMGGAFYFHFRTWNTVWDPEAVRIMFEADMPFRVVSRDVSEKCVLSHEQVDALRSGDSLVQYLSKITDRWYSQSQRLPVLFDPLTIDAIFDDRYLKFRPEHVGVETRGEFTRGMTFVYHTDYYKWGIGDAHDVMSRKPVTVAHDVDGPGFVGFFMDRLLGREGGSA